MTNEGYNDKVKKKPRDFFGLPDELSAPAVEILCEQYMIMSTV